MATKKVAEALLREGINGQCASGESMISSGSETSSRQIISLTNSPHNHSLRQAGSLLKTTNKSRVSFNKLIRPCRRLKPQETKKK